MHATFRFLAIVGAAVGIYLAAVLQSGPEQVDAHICALARRWHINVPTQCSPWVDTLAAPLIWLFLAGCIIFLTIDFLWPRLVKVPWKNHLRDVRVKAAEIVNPKHMIILGLTGTIVFAAIALAGVIWQSRKPTVGDPRSTALQAENSDLKQKLTVAERQAEQARQRPAAPLPRMPGDPPLPRNPYPDGPIFQRTF